jgi:glutamate carboxypeptidase
MANNHSDKHSLEAQICDWLGQQQGAMLDLLKTSVNTGSGSYDKAGVDAVGRVFEKYFATEGVLTEREPHATFGDAIHVRLDDKPSNQRPIVLMGHRDTVFPKGEETRRPFTIEGSRAYGPGVADMKAGLVMNAFVLAAFKRFGGNPAPLAGLITSDEEIASPSSRPIIERVGRAARCVFNSEPGRPTGAVVTGRKGGVFMEFTVTGKAAHSGGAFEKGISAIGEMAHKIVAIHALTDLSRGVTLNVGIVSGGQSVNTTAPSAEGHIDMRYVQPADRKATLAAIDRIMATNTVPGATAHWKIRGEFLPLTASSEAQSMFEGYRHAAADAGLTIAGEFSGGCADSGFTAAVGCPTLCSVGPVGGNAHTAEEYLEIDSLVPRAQALALAILRLPPEPQA